MPLSAASTSRIRELRRSRIMPHVALMERPRRGSA
jgi:hypothetical protein